MKRLKIVGLLAIATLGLAVFAGAGTAHATALCTTTDTPVCTMSYGPGTSVDLSLKTGTSMQLLTTGSETLATCTGGTLNGKVGTESSKAVSIELSEATWSSCNQTTDTISSGSLEVEHIEGTHNGTVKGKGTEWTFGILGVSCTYGFGTSTDLGTLVAGEEPSLNINITINKTTGGFLCPSNATFKAEYVITSPHALYLTEEGVGTGGILCTTTDTPECTMSYLPGRAVDLSLKSGASMQLATTGGEALATCTGGTINGKIGAEASGAVSIENSEATWSNCNHTTDTITAGLLEVEHIEGAHNGTVKGKSTEWTFGILGVSCNYGYGTSTDLGTLVGGEEPTLSINIAINKTAGGFLCPSTATFKAEYVVTSPHALYVDQEGTGTGGILCTTADTSECTMSYKSGRAIDLSLKSGASMQLSDTSTNPLATCTGGTLNGKRGTEAGGVVSIELSEAAWSSCDHTVDTLAAGSLEIEPIKGTHNGTVKGKSTEWTFGILGVSCTYGYGTSTDLGTLVGGEEPTLSINIAINKTAGGFLCPSTATFKAEYVVTSPHALYVI